MDLKIDDYWGMWKRQFEEQEKYIQEVRSVKHDMQAHLIVLQYYLEDGKCEEAKAYLKNMRNQEVLFRRDREIEVGNTLINVLLKEYLKKSKEDIGFFCKGALPEDAKVTDYDWCTIFSNLISNAIEACEKLNNIEKSISLEISTDEQNLYVIMANPIEWEVKKELLGKGTTKADKKLHGYGLKNIKSIVEKYQGNLDYICEKNTFAVKICFPHETQNNFMDEKSYLK